MAVGTKGRLTDRRCRLLEATPLDSPVLDRFSLVDRLSLLYEPATLIGWRSDPTCWRSFPLTLRSEASGL